jgi:hypothetical protein
MDIGLSRMLDFALNSVLILCGVQWKKVRRTSSILLGGINIGFRVAFDI